MSKAISALASLQANSDRRRSMLIFVKGISIFGVINA